MSFFSTLTSIGTLQPKRPNNLRSTNPIEHSRNIFTAGVQKQLAMIAANEIGKPGSWIAQDGENFLVSLRYKRVPMKLDGTNVWLRVGSIELVKEVLVHAMKACAGGQFDQLFLDTASRRQQSVSDH